MGACSSKSSNSSKTEVITNSLAFLDNKQFRKSQSTSGTTKTESRDDFKGQKNVYLTN